MSKRPFSRHLGVVLLLSFLLLGVAGCSAILNFEECTTQSDCPGGNQCTEGICVTQSISGCSKRSDCGSDASTYCLEGSCKKIDLNKCAVKSAGFKTHPDEVIIPIAAMMPLTGPNAEKGINTSQGAELALSQINAAGGARGAKFGLLVCDTEYEANKAADLGTYVTTELGVDVLLGAISSAESFALVDRVAQPNKTLMISPASTSPGLSARSDYFWRTIPSDALQAPAMADLIAMSGYNEVVVLYGGAADPYSSGFFQALTFYWDQNPAAKPEKVVFGQYDVDDPVASVALVDANALYAKGNDPDAIVLIGTNITNKLLGELEAQVIGPKSKTPQWYLSEAMRDQTLLQNTKAMPAFDRITGTISLRNETPIFSNFKSFFQAEFQSDPTNFQYADKAYDAAFLAALTIEAQEAPFESDGEALQEVMTRIGTGTSFNALGTDFSSAASTLREGGSISLVGVSGQMTFTDKRDIEGAKISKWVIDTANGANFVTQDIPPTQ